MADWEAKADNLNSSEAPAPAPVRKCM